MAFFKVTIVAALFLGLHFSECSQLEMMDDGVSRIVNGNLADYSQFPYVVSLQLRSALAQQTRGHTCGGVLISYQHALTSASCLFTGTALKNPADYRVFAGASLLTNDTSVNHYRNIVSFTPHPNYTGINTYVNDIGIITLDTPFLNTTVTPLALSTVAPADNVYCTAAGWGATLAGATASVNLLYVNRLTINQTACSVMSPAAGGPAAQNHMLCVGTTVAFTPSCTNDTGNPLVCDNTLTGVLSWFPACSLNSNLEVYTRTADFAAWVSGATQGVTGAAAAHGPLAAILAIAAIFALLISH